MKAQDYPITLRFGDTRSPYSGTKPHHGIDYAAPEGTPVVVAGVEIGLVGSTGYSTGPHLHVDKNNGSYIDPSDWVSIASGTVTFADENGTAGKQVSISANGCTYRFLHLSKINVTEGEVIGDMITKEDVGPVRIVMSEVEGWNGEEIHSGKHDETIMGAWVGKKWTDFLWHCWSVQSTHRHHLSSQVDQLSKANTIKDNEIKRLQSQLAVQGQDTIQLNKAGEALKWLIARLGLK